MDFRTYLDLEQSLAFRLILDWSRIAPKLFSAIQKKLDAGDYKSASLLANSISFAPIFEKNKSYIRFNLRATMSFGGGLISGNKSSVSTGSYDTFLDKVMAGFSESLETNVSSFVRLGVLQLIANYETTQKKEVVKKEAYVRDFVSFKDSGDSMLQLVSSLHTSRLSTWGFTAEAGFRGVEKYKLTAVLDGRTSKFCRLVDGKIFNVADARSSIVSILDAGPEASKDLQPWPNQSKAGLEEWASLTNDEIVSRNWHIPPFHPGCRTMLSLVGKTPPLRRATPLERDKASQKISSVDDFLTVGAKVGDSQLAYWNNMVALLPIEVLSKVSGLFEKDFLKLLSSKSKNSVYFYGDGSIGLKAQGVLEEGSIQSRAIYDPYTGVLSKSYTEISGVPVGKALEFYRRVFTGVFELANSLSAKKVVFTTTDTTSFFFASIGAVPSYEEWSVLRAQMLQDLETVYQPQFLKLPEEYKNLVLSMLNSSNPDSLYTLTNLDINLGGEKIGEILLGGKSFTAEVDTSDVGKMKAIYGVLK